MSKPIVHFMQHPGNVISAAFPSAYVLALDHPRLGHQWVRTSEVLTVCEDKHSFETQNTIYVEVPKDQAPQYLAKDQQPGHFSCGCA